MRYSFILVLCALPMAAFAQDQKAPADAAIRVAMVPANDAAVSVAAPWARDGECSSQMDDESLRELVQTEAKRLGVDEKLGLVILNLESKDGASLNSSKGARGPMQLMPATAAQYGVTDICNPVENVRGGLLFLKDLSTQFHGNMMLVAAAYNAGSERVYQAKGVPAFSETVRYVAAATNKYYGLDELLARRGKGSAARNRADTASVDHVAEAPASKAEPAKKQEWIGGSVLYVSSGDEGDK